MYSVPGLEKMECTWRRRVHFCDCFLLSIAPRRDRLLGRRARDSDIYINK